MKQNKKNLIVLVTFVLLLQMSFSAMGAPVIIGNGDDGDDLESFTEIKKGKIIETRFEAVQVLKKFEVYTIEGLGNLLPELENTKLYMTKQGLDVEELAELGAFTADQGLVYSRTLPQLYAATRFYPAAKNLDRKQLISLHIHEALHRALPEDIREDEKICSQITSTITSPETSRDAIAATVKKYIKGHNVESAKRIANNHVTNSTKRMSKTSRLHNPSKFSISMRTFDQRDNGEIKELGETRMKNLYLLSSHLYPFGEGAYALGLGLDFSYLKTDDNAFLGPLGLSLRKLIWTKRNFDIEMFGRANFNTLSDEELKSTALIRDTYRLGLTFATRRDHFFIENDLEYTFGSDITEDQLGINYTYKIGDIIGTRVKAGFRLGNLTLGGDFELLLLDEYEIDGGDFNEKRGRSRMVTVGPMIEYRTNKYSFGVKGRFIIDSTDDINFNYMADILGQGSGQGSIETQLNIFF
jgi:hypothetical protein